LSVVGRSANSTGNVADITAANDGQVLRRSGTSIGFGAVDLASTDAVTGDLPFANLAQGSALSVLGVTGNATADVASIAAGTDHQVLRRSGTSLAFGAISLTQSAAVTGILPIANGGTGDSTAQGAINALAGATTSGQYLRGNGSNVVMSAIQAGDVPTLNQNTTGSAATWTTARTLTIGSTGKSVNGSGNVTWTLAEVTGTTAAPQFGRLGVGTAASGTTGEIRATNNVTAFYSDARLKDIAGPIDNALEKLSRIRGVYYTQNKLAESFGYNNYERQVGVIAQEIKEVLPEAVKFAPFDREMKGDNEVSKSGEDYLTVQYEKLVPLLLEAIKELSEKVKKLGG
jgi:hypothetical protein